MVDVVQVSDMLDWTFWILYSTQSPSEKQTKLLLNLQQHVTYYYKMIRQRTFRVIAANEGATNVEAGLPHESVSVGQRLEDEVQQLLTDETVEVCPAPVDHRL